MYLKLVFNGNYSINGSAISGWGPMFTAIANFATGAWTSTSQITSTAIIKESSVVSGTAPTSGIYTASILAGTNSQAWAKITKHHYAKGQNGGTFQAKSIMMLDWNNSSGFRVRYNDALEANGYPIPSPSNMPYLSSVTGSSGPRWSAASGSDLINIGGISVIHCIITDHVLLIQVQTDGASTVKDYGTWMLADLEHIPSIDNYAYSSNARYTPQAFAYWFWPNSMDAGQGSGSGGTTTCTGLYRTQYLDQFGTYRNTQVGGEVNTTLHYGPQSYNSQVPVMHPRPMNRVFQIPVTSGDYAHQLIPLMYNGHSDPVDGFGDPRHSRLMSVFRTSEDLGFTGDIITEGSGNFRIFRIHKCGRQTPAIATFNACYAFPEFNIPYGS